MPAPHFLTALSPETAGCWVCAADWAGAGGHAAAHPGQTAQVVQVARTDLTQTVVARPANAPVRLTLAAK